jgi:AsmA protein
VGKSLKIILSLFASIAFIIVLIAGGLFVLVNPNDFKANLITAVKTKTGRDLTIAGDLKLSFYPVLGFSTGAISLANEPEFQPQPFATLDDARVSVELMPLFSNRVEISGVELKGLTINLTNNKQGQKNWQDLTGRKLPPVTGIVAPTAQQASAAAIGGLLINHVSLVDAHINWHNVKTGKQITITGLNASTDTVGFNKPVALNMAFVVSEAGSNNSHVVKLDTVLNVNEHFDTFAFSQTKLQTTSTGDNIPNHSLVSALLIKEGSLSIPQQTIRLTYLQLNANDLNLTSDLSGEQIFDNPFIQGTVSTNTFNAALLLKSLAIPIPVMSDSNALSKLSVSFSFLTSQFSWDVSNLLMTVDDSTITGAISIKNPVAPSYAYDLAIDSLDIDRYLPPRDKTQKPITSPTIALTVGAEAIPAETLKKLNLSGHIAAKKIIVNDLTLQDVQFNLSAKDGVVNTQQAAKQFYQGEYLGNSTIDTRKTPILLAINEKLSHVQIEPLLQDFKGKANLRGTLDAAAQLQGRGRTQAELRDSLTGNLHIAFKDGAILDFSLQKMLDKGKALLKGADPDLTVDSANEQTPFHEISGTATAVNGLINNPDLLIKTPKVHITGSGTAHLVTEQLDYKLSGNVGKSNATLVILVGGTFSQPTYKLDLSALFTEEVKNKVENVIQTLQTDETKNKVENTIQNLQTDENKAKVQNILDKLKPEQKEQIKELAPKVGKFLKKLF